MVKHTNKFIQKRSTNKLNYPKMVKQKKYLIRKWSNTQTNISKKGQTHKFTQKWSNTQILTTQTWSNTHINFSKVVTQINSSKQNI